jgi:chorismate dehydratase
MNLTVGYIPFLNMVPFHQGFGPAPIEKEGLRIQFRQASPRALGADAESGLIDAGAMSLIDAFRLEGRFEPLGPFGIGVKRAAGSVLLFSKVPMREFEGMCAVTDETSTSVRLLQVLLEKRYGRTNVHYGRVAVDLYDGSADGLLLIGDEALRARRDGVKGLPVVTDLATEWFSWQSCPFVFARWVVRKDLDKSVKNELYEYLENSLKTMILTAGEVLNKEAGLKGFTPSEISAYWEGFLFKLTPDHEQAMAKFRELSESVCLTA